MVPQYGMFPNVHMPPHTATQTVFNNVVSTGDSNYPMNNEYVPGYEPGFAFTPYSTPYPPSVLYGPPPTSAAPQVE